MQLNALDNEFIFNLVIEIRDEIEGKDTFVRVKRLNVVFFKVLATITYAILDLGTARVSPCTYVQRPCV